MAVNPPVVIPEANTARTASGALLKMSGIISTPNPNEMLIANTKVSLRPIC